MYTPEFADITTLRDGLVERSVVIGIDMAQRESTAAVRQSIISTSSLYFLKFDNLLKPYQKDGLEESLASLRGRLTGGKGPFPNSFAFQVNVNAWDEVDWENWHFLQQNLVFHCRLDVQNSRLPQNPQNQVLDPTPKIEQAQDSISPYKANLEAAGWTDLQDVELCTGRETWGCPPGGVCPRKVTHEDIQQYVEAKLMATRERINALLKALPGDIADPMQYAAESVQQFGATVSELPEQVLRDFEGGQDESI